MNIYDDLIWKRIYRIGQVCSNDLEQMLGVTNVHASRIIKNFTSTHSNKVYKKGRFVKLFPQETVPDSILNTSLIDEINVQQNISKISGLFNSEIPIVDNTVSNHKKLDRFLITIIQAIKSHQPLEVVYVSLTYKKSPDEKEKPRILFPVSFRFFDGLWYLIALDIKDKNKQILKMFSLSRFHHVAISKEKVKIEPFDERKKVRFFLTFNSSFTEEQKNIIIDELQLTKFDNLQYCIDIYEYEKFSFKRKYLSSEKPSSDSMSIYPFFVSHTEQPI